MASVREHIKEMDAEPAAEASGKMMDIRFFIGLLFVIYGVIITIYGIINPSGTAGKEVVFNLNFYWGIVLLIFGLVFYIPSDKPNKWAK